VTTTIIGVRYDEGAGSPEACLASYAGIEVSRDGGVACELFFSGDPEADYLTAHLVTLYRSDQHDTPVMASSSLDHFAMDAEVMLRDVPRPGTDITAANERAARHLESKGETEAAKRAAFKIEWTLRNLPETCSLKVQPWDGGWRATLNFTDDDANCLAENGPHADAAIRRVLEAARQAKPALPTEL